MQRAPGESDCLHLEPGHAMARGDRIERGSRIARRDVEHHLVLHEACLTQRRQIEAVAQRRGATLVGLVALIALISLVALLALPLAGRRTLPGRRQRNGLEWRYVRRPIDAGRRVGLEYLRADKRGRK